MRILILILLCTLCGCSNATKKTDISLPQTVELDFKVPLSGTQGEDLARDTQPVTIKIEQVVTLSGLDVATRTTQEPVTDTDADVPLALGMPGSTPSSSVGNLTQEGIESSNTVPVVVTPKDTTNNTTTTTTAPATNSTTPTTAITDLLATEKVTLHWSEDRGRQVTWLKHPASHYGLPIRFELSGACSGAYVITELNPVYIGSTAFTVVDDFHFGSGNPKAAEVLAPMKCGQSGTVELLVKYKDAANISDTDLLAYSYETHSMKDLEGNNKKYAWMSHKGAYYGKNIIAKYSDGESWVIKDGAYAQGEDGNSDNHNQMFWMSGNPDQQEDTHMGCEGGCASIFSKPGSDPDPVTLYYKVE